MYDKGNLYSFFIELLSSLRKNVIKDNQIPYHEICLAIACFLKICEHLSKMISMNDDDTFIYLNENHSKEKEIIEIFESANYYTIPNFKFLLNHLKK